MAARATTASRTFDERWDDMFQRLVAFKAKFGHCLVPNRYPEDKKLGAWVSAQRRHYKILISKTKESTPMTVERAQKLIDLGFDWSTTDPRHVSWEDRYKQLKDFYTTYGHTKVPMNWSENSSLSNWVSSQRQHYKLFRKGGPSHLTQEQIDKLNDIGFVWEAQRGGRRRKLQALSELQNSPEKTSASKIATLPTNSDTFSLDQAVLSAGLPRHSLHTPHHRSLISGNTSNMRAALATSLDSHVASTPASLPVTTRPGLLQEMQLLSSIQRNQPVQLPPAFHVPAVTNLSWLGVLSDTEKALLRNKLDFSAPSNSDRLLQQLIGQRLDEEQRTANAIDSLVARERQLQHQGGIIRSLNGICQSSPTALTTAAGMAASRLRQSQGLSDSLLPRSTVMNERPTGLTIQNPVSYFASQTAMERNMMSGLGHHQSTRVSSFLPIREGRQQSIVPTSEPAEDTRKRPRRES